MGVKYRVMIQIKNLIHNYTNGTCALAGVDLEIADGEFVSIIGANGCGKSTLARHINGLLLPTSGQVLVDGLDTRDENNIWTIRQKVGMVFQNPDNQIVASVVEDDVAFAPENLGVSPEEIRRRVDEALKCV
ncbi:MAG: ATP-binding cassette domain-containing protein, partial [Acidaminococcaceae bacterium]|nr:ATP-binding cassette domain-containing protein [Acidaminococcaceae bacterium]